MRRRIALVALALLPVPMFAQDAYPSRPVTMVVAFPPGGVADITARPTAFAMEKLLKQRVIIENSPGAPGAPGTSSLSQAKPHGFPLLTTLSPLSLFPHAPPLLAQ